MGLISLICYRRRDSIRATIDSLHADKTDTCVRREHDSKRKPPNIGYVPETERHTSLFIK